MALIDVPGSGPAVEPVTVAEAKLHCRVDGTAFDDAFDRLIKASRRHVERFLHRRLITQTVQLRLSGLGRAITLPIGPVQSIESITYLDTANVSQTLAADQYRLDMASVPNRIVPAHLVTWPSVLPDVDTVAVNAVVGYGDAADDVPDDIREAILKIVAFWHDNPEAVVTGAIATELPLAFRAMLVPYVLWV